MVAWSSLQPNLLDDFFAAGQADESIYTEGMDSFFDSGDRYLVEKTVGQGSQGVVYRAHDTTLDRLVAIKCVHSNHSQARKHIQDEKCMLAQLAHPSIPLLYDFGRRSDGTSYLVMELREGERLDHFLTQRPELSRDDRLRVFLRIASALEHAHGRGIVHRDLKPSNIIISADLVPAIIDWGLSGSDDERHICGSPHFAAPEQLEGQLSDGRADVYALGVLLYVLLSGDLPYARQATDFNEFRQVRAGIRLLPLRKRCPDISKELERITIQAMAPQPGARFQSVSLFRESVRAVLLARGRAHFGIVTLIFAALSGALATWLVFSFTG